MNDATNPLPDDIRQWCETHFPVGFDALAELAPHARIMKSPRLVRCILHLSEGDPAMLRDCIRLALQDERDVIWYAEYERVTNRRLHDFNFAFDRQPEKPEP